MGGPTGDDSRNDKIRQVGNVSKQAERLMGKLREIARKVVGGAKEVTAEVIGDARLSEEGKAQRREPEPAQSDPESSKPFGNLDRLT